MYPPDVSLPLDAKYFGFIDHKKSYNPHWDITWSFTFNLSGTNHAICTFLTDNPNLSSGIPGQYLGFQGSYNYLRDEYGNILLTEGGDRIFSESSALTGYEISGVIGIAFDSTGYFALSNDNNPGIGLGSVKPDSLIIRDGSSNLILNESLSSLDSDFTLVSETPQTIRIRWANGGGKLSVDYKTELTTYKNLKTLSLSHFNPNNYDSLYPGFVFCSPLSGSSSPSTLRFKNFHTQGNLNDPTYEVSSFEPILKTTSNYYTTISGITAIPV